MLAWTVVKHVKSNAIVYANARADGGRGRGPDEPRRRRALRRPEGAAPAEGHGGRLGRVLPLPRRPRRDRARRRHRGHPARRLREGRGSDRRRRRAQAWRWSSPASGTSVIGGCSRLSLRIAVLSAAVLFLEMLLVRWVGTEVRIFAYLQNAVLVSAFLGSVSGVAPPIARSISARPPVPGGDRPVHTRSAGAGSSAKRSPQGLTAFQDSVVWSTDSQSPQYARVPLITFAAGVTLGLLGAVAAVFQPLGQWLGRWMDEHPRPIAAYTINILGSLAGIAVFDLLTVARTPPWVWLAVASLLLLFLLPSAQAGRYSRSGGGGSRARPPAARLGARGQQHDLVAVPEAERVPARGAARPRGRSRAASW